MQIRRMADASLALAERRAGDLKVATERLGAEVPSSRALLMLRVFGIIAPPSSAGIIPRIRGIVILILGVIAILALGFGIVEGVGQAAGGISLDLAIFYGLALVFVVIGGLAFWGRRRGRAAQAKRREETAARAGGR
jgi:peptidoglycan/LPS O-acetylase OafA/YrhL